ncbi:hypothetical protein [Porphyromonas cangingivalis]|nr:hypothetical protein [Porphyromonas cangingivalis]
MKGGVVIIATGNDNENTTLRSSPKTDGATGLSLSSSNIRLV